MDTLQGFDKDTQTSNRDSHVSIENGVFPSGECWEEDDKGVSVWGESGFMKVMK